MLGHRQQLHATASCSTPSVAVHPHCGGVVVRYAPSVARAAAVVLCGAYGQAETVPAAATPALQQSSLPTAAGQQVPAKGTPQPSAVRRCQNVYALCRMLEVHQAEVSPRFWCTALCHLLDLIAGGQQVHAQGWKQLKAGLAYLTTTTTALPAHTQPTTAATARSSSETADCLADHRLQQQQSPAAVAGAAAAPICQFTGAELATLLWACAKLGLQLPQSCWPAVLQHMQSVSQALSPRDAALLAWSLVQLKAAMNPEWFSVHVLEAQAQKLPAYPPRSLLILLYSCVRMSQKQQGGLMLPAAWEEGLMAALQQHLRTTTTSSSSSNRAARLSGRDLALLLWCLPGLGLRPPGHILAGLLSASRPLLSGLSCAELSALLVGVGRLRYLPPGSWLLDVFDQLYWTADQLELRQLAGVVWSLGRLRLVAVPTELQDRLMAFVAVRLKQHQQQLQQQLEQQQHSGDQQYTMQQQDGSPQQQEVLLSDLDKQRFSLAKQLSLLLVGLAGLRQQLSRQQLQHCGDWLLLVLQAASPATHLQVALSLHAATQLKVRLQPGACCQVLQALQASEGAFILTEFALAAWGALGVGCRPSREWVGHWLQLSIPMMGSAGVGELHMLLQVVIQLGAVPDDAWWRAAVLRLQQLVPGMSGSNCLMLVRLLLGLYRLHTASSSDSSTASYHPGILAPGGGAAPVPQLLAQLSVRMEQLEVERQVGAGMLESFESCRRLLLEELRKGSAAKRS